MPWRLIVAITISGYVSATPTPDRTSARPRQTGTAGGDGWAYEPKYDGFRALAFVDGEELLLQSRGGKPLQRYFPELRLPGRAATSWMGRS